MTTKATPQIPFPRSGAYDKEPNTFSDMNDLFRFFRRLKVSKNSPPVLNKDVSELEMTYDKTLNRLYIVADGTLRYVQFT